MAWEQRDRGGRRRSGNGPHRNLVELVDRFESGEMVVDAEPKDLAIDFHKAGGQEHMRNLERQRQIDRIDLGPSPNSKRPIGRGKD